jgi:hypothetical protein
MYLCLTQLKNPSFYIKNRLYG